MTNPPRIPIHMYRARARSAKVAWFFIGVIAGLVIAAAWVSI